MDVVKFLKTSFLKNIDEQLNTLYCSVSLFFKKKIVSIEEITLSIDPTHRLMTIECAVYPTATRTF